LPSKISEALWAMISTAMLNQQIQKGNGENEQGKTTTDCKGIRKNRQKRSCR
jgi:hypothetical protein